MLASRACEIAERKDVTSAFTFGPAQIISMFFEILRRGFLPARDIYQHCLTELVSTRVLKQSRRIFLAELLPAGSTC